MAASTARAQGPLTARQRAVLATVCDTLVPVLHRDDDPGGLFGAGARRTGTPERVEQLIAALPDPLDRARLRLVLSVLGSPVATLLATGRARRFTDLGHDARERILRGWAYSMVPLRRAGFQALKRLVHLAYLCWPLDNGSHPAWRAAGYPGPLPPPADGIAPLPVEPIAGDAALDCDVVVVGSGAGGGVAAGVLAAAGRSVVVLEMGENLSARAMSQIEGEMLQRGYLHGGLYMTQNGAMPILAGSCVGGGTVINYTTSFALPDDVRAEWDERSGLSLFSSPRFAESLARVTARSGVGTRWTTPSARDRILERGCRALGWHVDALPRNVTGCLEGLECGYCGYGCRHGAKNSTAQTYLRDAAAAGGRVIARCAAQRVLIEGGRATGVVAVARGPDGRSHSVTVRARAVVVACGALHTPALLRRSGLTHRALGSGLRLHPATAVLGIFPERVEPWSGALQTRYSAHMADLHGGYGVRFETAPVHFALAASGFGWDGARRFREDVARLAHHGLVGVLLRDRDAGRVAVSRRGHPRVHYELSRFDVRHVREGLRGAARVLAEAGATELVSLHTPPVRVRPDTPGWLDRFTAGMDARGYRRCRMSYITFHQMATAPMGANARTAALSETGETYEVRNLYVADGSAFPTSSGVNPMLTIMAIADHVARAIAEAW